jgi:hypothetical protein
VVVLGRIHIAFSATIVWILPSLSFASLLPHKVDSARVGCPRRFGSRGSPNQSGQSTEKSAKTEGLKIDIFRSFLTIILIFRKKHILQLSIH